MNPLKSVFASCVGLPIVQKLKAKRQTTKSQTKWTEMEWSSRIAEQIGGEVEVTQPNGNRVDILTQKVAYEVEWSNKWAEAIGQSILYGIQTNRRPGIIMLLRGNYDEDYLECLCVIETLKGKGIDIKFETISTTKPFDIRV